MNESVETYDSNSVENESVGSNEVPRSRYRLRDLVRMALIVGIAAVIMIWERNQFNRLSIKEMRLNEELGSLRAEAISLSAELMKSSQESRVQRLIEERGIPLEPASEPARVIDLVDE